MTAVAASPANTAPGAVAGHSRWSGLTGVLFGLLLVGSAATGMGMPDAKNPAKVQAWDVKHTGLLNGSVILTFAAVLVGGYFLTWLHSRLVGQDRGWAGTMYVVGIVIYAMSGAISAGIDQVVSTDAKHLSTGSLQLMASVNQNFVYPVTAMGLALLFFAVGCLIRQSGVLPGWLKWMAWVFAFFSATYFFGFVAMFGSALFVIAAGVVLAVRAPAEN